MLRTVLSYVFAAALLLLSQSAFRQALGEFRDTEPGSLLFGALQVVIGTSTVLSAVGLVKRARWAAPSVAVFGVAAAALLAVQPLFEPMDADAKQSIWFGAALVAAVAAGVSWFASRLHRSDAASRESAQIAPVSPLTPALLVDTQPPAEPLRPYAADANVAGSTLRQHQRPHTPDASSHE
jgi:hypothetical protein